MIFGEFIDFHKMTSIKTRIIDQQTSSACRQRCKSDIINA
ncbi:hypothetical protein HOLDEFILI_00547 [Holdemania filiformis DSM 12042]|uniref:Uncharacterized protein n=1 Tax=Holdemania filiformis DSM 12042 TaxID=545696 RepID=B9Y416_9FIRM|nr:hypothetical protein HOLDEFILI_00547 [Holdemania filiformis DSM 12042]